MIDSMFHVPVPLLEKILRPILVYFCLILFLRLFGKRELAQLNPFDLVVLLLLSNTVQNASIGNDNSLLGGVEGAFSLLTANFLLNRVLYRMPWLDKTLQGKQTVLIHDGVVDKDALKRELLTKEELVQVVHRQNITGLQDVKQCVLEPNGTFYVEAASDSTPRIRHDELLDRLDALTREIAELRAAR